MVFLMQGGGNVGSAVAQSHLRSILVSIGAIVMGQPEVYFLFKPNAIDGQGEIAMKVRGRSSRVISTASRGGSR